MTSFTAASREIVELDQPLESETVIVRDADRFEVPATEAQSRKQFLIRLQVKVVLDAGSEVTIEPAFEALDGSFDTMTLPPVRARGIESEAGAPDNLVARIQHGAVFSEFAVLPDTGEVQRRRIQALLDAWLASLSSPNELTVNVQTRKRLTASGNVTKAAWSVKHAELNEEKRWRQLFDAKRDYEVATIELTAGADVYPIAGAAIVASTPAGVLNAAVWFINHPSVFARLHTSAADQERIFAAWLEEGDALQASVSESTWFPIVSESEGERTLYERTVPDVIHRSYRGMQMRSLVTSPRWPTQRLRMIGRTVWLGERLASNLDVSTLDGMATVERVGDLLKIARNDGVEADTFERALRPILPSADDILTELRERLPQRRAEHRWSYMLGLQEIGAALVAMSRNGLAAQRLREAIAAFESALGEFGEERYPLGLASVQIDLAEAMLLLGIHEKDIESMQRGVATYRTAVETLRDAMQEHPGSRRAWTAARVQLANALLNLGERETGTQSLEEALRIFNDVLPEYPPEEGSLYADHLKRAAVQARSAVATALIAERTNDVPRAVSALEAAEAALSILQSSPHWAAFTPYEASLTRVREIRARMS